MYTVKELLESHACIETAFTAVVPTQDLGHMRILLAIRESLEARIHYQLSRFKIFERALFDATGQNQTDRLMVRIRGGKHVEGNMEVSSPV